MPSGRRARCLVLSLAMVLVAGACRGGDGDDEGTAAPAEQTTSTAPGTSGAPTAATGPPTTAAAGTTAPKADAGPHAFRAPSGNVGCYIDDGSARCDILQYEWSPPPKPADCELDWGGALYVDKDGPVHACRSDTVLGADEVLAYGQVARRGPIECTSAESGVTCTYTPTGRGFTISRRTFSFF